MIRYRLAAVIVVAAASFVSAPAGARNTKAPAAPSAPELELTDASPSIDDLVSRFLDALERKDWQALRKLRVTESEYKNIIMVGAIGQGQPLSKWPENTIKFYWDSLNTKSAYYETYLIGSVGGHRYQVNGIAYAKGTQRYANHFAYKQVRLKVEDETGNQTELATGSIVEVGGQYKFVSFIRD